MPKLFYVKWTAYQTLKWMDILQLTSVLIVTYYDILLDGKITFFIKKILYTSGIKRKRQLVGSKIFFIILVNKMYIALCILSNITKLLTKHLLDFSWLDYLFLYFIYKCDKSNTILFSFSRIIQCIWQTYCITLFRQTLKNKNQSLLFYKQALCVYSLNYS